MGIRRFFIGWNQPIVELANEFLLEELDEEVISKTLVLVPSKQAARKLKNRYRENSKFDIYPIFGTPETALNLFEQDSERPAT